MPDRLETGRLERGLGGPEERSAGWGLAVALLLVALLVVMVNARRQPSPPKPADAPAAEASAGRSREVLRDLLGDGRPHPLGSPADAAVRERIVARLRGLGYTPQVEQGVACAGATCGRVQNVVARLDGTQPTGAVLLMAHYDSVPAGPGAGDDLSGVATILEVARALKAGPAPKNTILFLLDEGEEAGLLGARDFADHSRLTAEVKAIVNFEARGTFGPSLMFETSGKDNAWIVGLYAARAPHPVTSSVFATIYDLMPNNTDLSIFKRRDFPGLNFAFVGGPLRYHTASDNLANVSPASLQHHGDNALAAVQGLAQADLAHPPPGRVVFFDVLGMTVVHWPMGASLGIALLTLLLVLVATVVVIRRGAATAGGVLLGFLSFLATVALAGIAAYGLSTVALSAPVSWVDSATTLVAAFWLVSLAVAGFIAVAFLPRARPTGLWAGAWLGWAVLGVLLVVALPAAGASYLFVVPALVAALAGLLLIGRDGAASGGGTLAVLLAVLAAGILWFPIVIPLYDGLGSGALVPIAVLLGIFFTAIAPLFAAAPTWMRRSVAPVAILAAVLCIGIVAAANPYSEQSPQPLNFLFHQDADSGKARWIVDGPPPVPAGVPGVAFAAQPERTFPWAPPEDRSVTAPAPALGAPAPTLTVVADTIVGGKRQLRVRLASPRGAQQVLLYIPAAAHLESEKIDGVDVRFRSGSPIPFFGWFEVTYMTLPPEGVEMEFVLADSTPQDWYLVDRSYGLPPGGEALVKARPATAGPRQDGDLTLVSRKIRV